MTWDLTSYFPQFDGPEMRQFKEALRSDVASLREQAAALPSVDAKKAPTPGSRCLLVTKISRGVCHT